MAAGTALVAGGLLILGRQRRSGMVVAAAGTALALLDHQDKLRVWWQELPTFVSQVQHLVAQVQDKVSEIAARREAFAEAVEAPDLLRKED